MKLKSLAALIFRILGAFFILGGIGGALSAIFEAQAFVPITEGVGSSIVGYFLMFYSRNLARLFCRGLDDDSA